MNLYETSVPSSNVLVSQGLPVSGTWNCNLVITVLWCWLSVPKHKKAVVCFMKKNVLDKLCSGMNCSAVSLEFNVNESKI